MSNSQDITFAKEGHTFAHFKNDTNISLVTINKASHPAGIPLGQPKIAYRPHDAQPKPWEVGRQWTRTEETSVPQFGTPFYESKSQTALTNAGMFGFVGLLDRSKQAVKNDKAYIFTTETGMGINLYFELHGTDGGSLIVPGFGLYNLNTNPGAWTYMKAVDFGATGRWGIELISPYVETALNLVVSYRVPDSRGNISHLIFDFIGAKTTWGVGKSNAWPSADENAEYPVDMPLETSLEHFPGHQEIITFGSGAYEEVDGNL